MNSTPKGLLEEMKSSNMGFCEKLKIKHAWVGGEEMYGFEIVHTQRCANCGLERKVHHEIKKWWSYSDGRPNEEIIEIKPV